MMPLHPCHHHELTTVQNNNRRMRTTFTPLQLKVLEKRFKSSHYIVGHERKQLAKELSLNESQVFCFHIFLMIENLDWREAFSCGRLLQSPERKIFALYYHYLEWKLNAE